MKTSTRVLFCLFALLSFLVLTAPGISGGKKVLITEVTVFDAKDKPAGDRQVILEFGSLKEPIFTDPAVTNAKGVAKVKHSLEGKVRVWVDGDYSTHSTTGKAPGKITVHLGGPSRFHAIDSHALQAPPEVEESVNTLAKYLAEPAQNDLEKVRAIYRWLTDRIAYDLDSFLTGIRGDNTPQGVLKTRQCVCEGYGKLFEALAKKMKLETAIIGGHYKGNGPILTEAKETRHAWNAVRIDGTWKLFDATMGAGAVVNKKWLKKTDEFFFQPTAARLLFSHFPNDTKWQFRDPPLTKEEFDASPAVPRQIFKMGLPAKSIWKMLKEKLKEFCKFFVTPGRKVILRDGPLAKTLQEGVKYRFLVEAADNPAVAFYQKENQVSFQKKGPLFEGFITPRKGILVILGMEKQIEGKGASGKGVVEYQVE